jgi:hypothetical protein
VRQYFTLTVDGEPRLVVSATSEHSARRLLDVDWVRDSLETAGILARWCPVELREATLEEGLQCTLWRDNASEQGFPYDENEGPFIVYLREELAPKILESLLSALPASKTTH